MRNLSTMFCVIALVSCVPEYDPFADAATDAEDATVECTALPPPIPAYPPDTIYEFESVTGYDHRGGVADDRGVIHHEAFERRDSQSNTMLSLQDFRGPDADRTAGTTYRLEDEFCHVSERRCCDEPTWCYDEEVCGSASETPCLDEDGDCDERLLYCCDDLDPDDPDDTCCDSPICPAGDYAYLDCDLCVLYLVDCPYESLGGCERQFLAVQGSVTFDAFEKSDDLWNQDTLDALAVTMTDLRFVEVSITPETFSTEPACPLTRCPAHEGDPEGCLDIGGYSFSYVAEE